MNYEVIHIASGTPPFTHHLTVTGLRHGRGIKRVAPQSDLDIDVSDTHAMSVRLSCKKLKVDAGSTALPHTFDGYNPANSISTSTFAGDDETISNFEISVASESQGILCDDSANSSGVDEGGASGINELSCSNSNNNQLPPLGDNDFRAKLFSLSPGVGTAHGQSHDTPSHQSKYSKWQSPRTSPLGPCTAKYLRKSRISALPVSPMTHSLGKTLLMRRICEDNSKRVPCRQSPQWCEDLHAMKLKGWLWLHPRYLCRHAYHPSHPQYVEEWAEETFSDEDWSDDDDSLDSLPDEQAAPRTFSWESDASPEEPNREDEYHIGTEVYVTTFVTS